MVPVVSEEAHLVGQVGGATGVEIRLHVEPLDDGHAVRRGCPVTLKWTLPLPAWVR